MKSRNRCIAAFALVLNLEVEGALPVACGRPLRLSLWK